jgi:hypothetical protein
MAAARASCGNRSRIKSAANEFLILAAHQKQVVIGMNGDFQ